MNKNRKGFTIVELVIVIAIIAILAAVLIPTFASLIAKANVSVDTQLVRNLNNALTAEKAGGENNKTMYDALMMVKSAGYDIDTIVSKSGNNIAWDSKNDRFVLIDPNNNTYIYPTESGADSYTIATPVDFFVIYNEVPAAQKYSIYLSKNATVAGPINVTVGFDAGENTAITALTYTGVGTAQNVVIRTNSFATTLTINDSSAQGKIYHYDNLGKLIITDCAMESYHEMGTVGYAELQNGHLVVEENASINLLFANTQDSATLKIKITNNGTITNAQASNDDVKQSNTISGVNFNRASGTVSDTVIQQAVQETHQSNCEHANIVVIKEAVEATCTQKGSTVEKKCQDCNKILVEQQEIPMIAHSLVSVAAVPATCIKNGNIEYWTCSVCGKLFSNAEATQETTANDVNIQATGRHTYVNHQCTVCETAEPGWKGFAGKVDATGKLETEAFKDNTSITTIVIPAGVTEIGNAAFQGCTSLTSVTIPDSVTKIGDSAFYGCTNLTNITIGKGVNSIKVGSGSSDSFGRTKLTTITVDSKNATYQSVGNALLNKAGTKLILGTASTVIPDTVTTIGNRAFLGREGLTTITIPASVTTIEDYAFSESSLTTIVIPSTVTKIGKYAFMSCKNLTTVTLSENISLIAEGLFSQCSELASITIPSKVTTIGGSAFNKCTKLTSITIPSSVTTIGASAFFESGLTSATIEGNNTWKAGQTSISRSLGSETDKANCLNGKTCNSSGTPYAIMKWTR